MNDKPCRVCEKPTPLSGYPKRAGGKTHRRVCWPCYKEQLMRLQLKRLYGMTLEHYQQLLEQQGHRCAICGNVNEDGRVLNVDHCHESDEIRGLLCGSCNRGLGMFRDSPERLSNAIVYLQRAGK